MPKSFSFWDHPIEALEKALHLRKQIEVLRKTVADIMGSKSSAGTVAKRRGRPPKSAAVQGTTKVDGRKGKRSAATRAKMAAAQKARWIAKKGNTAAKPVVNGAKKKRTMSPEARARIAAAQRARWAKAKKA